MGKVAPAVAAILRQSKLAVEASGQDSESDFVQLRRAFLSRRLVLLRPIAPTDLPQNQWYKLILQHKPLQARRRWPSKEEREEKALAQLREWLGGAVR